VPVWGFVEVPRSASPLAVSRYAQVLSHAAAELGAHTHTTLSVAGLLQAIAVYNQQRSLLADLKRHWLAGRVATATYRRLRRLALTQDPIRANQRLAQTLQEVPAGDDERPAAPTAPCPPRPAACFCWQSWPPRPACCAWWKLRAGRWWPRTRTLTSGN
jgi:hypothetical protein